MKQYGYLDNNGILHIEEVNIAIQEYGELTDLEIQAIYDMEASKRGLKPIVDNKPKNNKGYIYDTNFVEYGDRIEAVYVIDFSRTLNKKIRDKYSQDDEFAIQRKRDTNPQEFEDYNNYVEEIKKELKEAK